MKTKKSIVLRNLFLFIAMIIFLAPVSISQQVDAAGMNIQEYLERLKALEPDPPKFFTTRTGLGPVEIHVLDTLSPQERNMIESQEHPPAIGVIRDLRHPIYFKLGQIEIPEQEEITVSGGRLGWFNEDTLVFTTRIESQKADEIRVFFAEGFFPPGVKVNLFSDYKDAFTQVQLRGQIDEYGFYTTTTFADHAVIQVVIPSEAIKDDLYFEITKVIHVDNRYLPEDFRDCYENVNCETATSFSGIGSLRSSTARLRYPKGSFYYTCTGNLIMDSRDKDWQPFLLTANHCFNTQTSAAGLEARFNYWTTSCTNDFVNPFIIRTINGANIIATNSQTDFTLVLLKEFASNFFLGWTTVPLANNTILHSTHHPGGSPMHYLRVQKKNSPSITLCFNSGFTTERYHYAKVTHGRMLGGSSGASLVDASLRIRGQLYGMCVVTGWSHCNYDTYYSMWGRFNESYSSNNLQYWLNNGGASVAMSTSPVSLLTYGNVNVGSSVNLTVTVTNTGTVPNFMNLEAGDATLSGANADEFSIIGSNFLYLAPGESGTITVRFTPATAGSKIAFLTIPHNADNIFNPKLMTLTGTGVATSPCHDIISLAGGGSTNAKTFSKSGAGFWNTVSCGYNTPGQEQMYSFVAPFTGNYSIQVTETNSTYLNYFWKSGSCSQAGWNCISDVFSPGVYGNFTLTAGETYYILLASETPALTTQTFFIFFNPCQNITSIAGTGPENTQTYTGGGNGAWFTTTPSPCGLTSTGVENIYSFSPTVSGLYQIEVIEANGFVNYMWKSGACNIENWECISNLNAPGVYGNMEMIAGETYLILLDDRNTTSGLHQFFIRPPMGFSLELQVILEGAYTPGGPNLMHTILRDNGLVPLVQPYSPALPYFGNNNPVWYYTGTESVANIPTGVVDWVLVELRDAPSPGQALPATVIARKAAFLHNDGFIRGVSGEMLSFDLTIQNNLYVVVYHRNHLAVMSSGGLPSVGGIYIWDFTQGFDKAFVKTINRSAYLQGQKDLGGGIYGMYGGDGDGNGQIQTQDKNEVWNAESGLSGYRAGDFDMNSQVQTQDKNNIWNANSGVASQVP